MGKMSFAMNDIPRQKLKELVGRYGRSLGDDPLRCEGLLRDFCGQNRLEIFALSQAVKNGIPSELFNSSGQLPVEVTVLRFSKRLEDQCGMNPDLARWVVESWMLALGLASGEQFKLSAPKMTETPIPVTSVAQSPIAPPPTTPPPVQPPLAIPTVPTAPSLDMHVKKNFVPKLALSLVTVIIVASLLLIAKRYLNPEGTVYVKSDPAGATCYIDGKYVGLTPCEARDIRKSSHHVTVKKDGYEVENQSVEVESHGQHQVIIRLKSIAAFSPPPVTKGSVEIKSEPSGAKCYLDSNSVGITPRSLDGVEQGRHYVLVAKEGYQESKQEVTIQPGGKHEVIIHLSPLPSAPPLPPPALGGLSIRSEPPGAECYLNGRLVGKTPLELKDLEQITFQLVAKKDGYSEGTESVAVYPNTMREVTLRMAPLPQIPSGGAGGATFSKPVIPLLSEVPNDAFLLVKAMLDGSKKDEAVRIEAARARLQSLTKESSCLKKRDARQKNAEGLQAASKEDNVEAVRKFYEACVLCPNDLEALNNLGYALTRAGDYDNAEKALLKALALAPSRANGWANLGQVLSIKGDVSGGTACFLNAFRYSKNENRTTEALKNLAENDPFPTTQESAKVALRRLGKI